MRMPLEFRTVASLLAVPFLAMAACGGGETGSDGTDAAPAAITSAEMDDLRSGFLDAMEADDFATAATFYAEDAVFHHADGTKSRGRSQIEQHLAASGEGVTMSDVSLTPSDMGAGATMAWETGTFSATATPPGGEAMPVSSNYLVVVERQPDGRLLVVQDAEWPAAGEGGAACSREVECARPDPSALR